MRCSQEQPQQPASPAGADAARDTLKETWLLPSGRAGLCWRHVCAGKEHEHQKAVQLRVTGGTGCLES